MNENIYTNFEIEKRLYKGKIGTYNSAEDIFEGIFNHTNNDNVSEIELFNNKQANCLFSILEDDLSNNQNLTMVVIVIEL